MLCICWDWKGILHYDLFPRNQTINLDVYCSQLDRLKAAIDQKRPEFVNCKGVVFHHDNARPHAFLATRQKLMQLGWDVLPQLPYSPDLSPSDYHLFRSLKTPLTARILLPWKPAKNMAGFMKLPERWLKVIEKKMVHTLINKFIST
jgi:histone-lysine N-methyltransferase SETMAR